MPASQEITLLLQRWSDGDEQALEKLTPVLYEELHRMAHRYMRQERPGHTLQTTALINEAYLRLIGWNNVRWQNRAQFFAVSARLMRKILVDFARSRNYAKRGAGARVISAWRAITSPSIRNSSPPCPPMILCLWRSSIRRWPPSRGPICYGA